MLHKKQQPTNQTKALNACKFSLGLSELSYLSLGVGNSELVLKNLDSVSSMDPKAWTLEMFEEEAKILEICEQTHIHELCKIKQLMVENVFDKCITVTLK